MIKENVIITGIYSCIGHRMAKHSRTSMQCTSNQQPEPETSLTKLLNTKYRYTIQITAALQKYNTTIIEHTQ